MKKVYMIAAFMLAGLGLEMQAAEADAAALGFRQAYFAVKRLNGELYSVPIISYRPITGADLYKGTSRIAGGIPQEQFVLMCAGGKIENNNTPLNDDLREGKMNISMVLKPGALEPDEIPDEEDMTSSAAEDPIKVIQTSMRLLGERPKLVAVWPGMTYKELDAEIKKTFDLPKDAKITNLMLDHARYLTEFDDLSKLEGVVPNEWQRQFALGSVGTVVYSKTASAAGGDEAV